MSRYYKKYMKKREEEKPGYFKLFIGAFLLVIVFVGTVVTHLTSSVDTTIGENDDGDTKESGIGVKKHLIDSRLRFIQMDDASAPRQESAKPDIDKYGKVIQEERENQYSGKYKNSYGYDETQQIQPYSQTYNNTKTQYNTYGSSANYSSGTTSATNGSSAVTSSSSANKTTSSSAVTIPQKTQNSTSSHTSSPAYNIQKNLTPTGMN